MKMGQPIGGNRTVIGLKFRLIVRAIFRASVVRRLSASQPSAVVKLG